MTIKVVYKDVGELPCVWYMNDTLEAMQQLVGGQIEEHNLGDGLLLMCNEDGKINGMPENSLGIAGPYFVTRVNDNGDSIDVSREDCQFVINKINSGRR
jgi:hypothetical protein